MSKILVVDDDIYGREPVCRFLQKAGYEVETVSNGKEALSSLLASPPDVMLLDLFMPEMDGARLLEVLRSYLRLQSLPVVVLTGVSQSPLVERARSLKVNSILVKANATLKDILQAVEAESHHSPT